MFSTLKAQIALAVYILVMISIPVGSYFLSQRNNYQNSAEQSSPLPSRLTTNNVSPAKQLQDDSEKLASLNTDQATQPDSSPATLGATSFGPTLNLKVNLEGRPKDNQATKLFVGIVEGAIYSSPKFLLSFTVDLPASGVFTGLSLAGLTSGTKYTALLKGQQQIATSAAFIMSPTVTSLNNNEPINMLSGDLNEDNTVNTADYNLAQKALGTRPSSEKWNENADINKDSLVNSLDLSFIRKNLGKSGDSGSWSSPLTATPSAELNTDPHIGGLPDGSDGYWIFVPKQ